MYIKKITLLLIIASLMSLIIGCSSSKPTIEEKPIIEKPIAEKPITDKPSVNKSLMFTELGSKIAASIVPNFNALKLRENLNSLYIARVDDLVLSGKYSQFNSDDAFIENGIIAGLLNSGIKLTEKLSSINLRDAADVDYNTMPKRAFYQHTLNLNDLSQLKQDKITSHVLLYNVIKRSDNGSGALVYFRVIDINSYKIVLSELVNVNMNDGKWEDELKKDTKASGYASSYQKIVDELKKKRTLIETIKSNVTQCILVNIDLLNVSNLYKTPIDLKSMAREDAITTFMVDVSKDGKASIYEKTKNIVFKYPSVYKNIVFNTNPLIYEDWQEYFDNIGYPDVMFYRTNLDSTLSLYHVNAKNSGEVSFYDYTEIERKINSTESSFNLFSKIDSHKMFKDEKLLKLIKGKRIILVDGDGMTTNFSSFEKTRQLYDYQQCAIEEGMASAIISNSNTTKVVEKLKTLYYKRDAMYASRVFYPNPLYLDNWKQLKDAYGVDLVLVYNNTINYSSPGDGKQNLSKISVAFRLIDLTDGSILYANFLN